MFHRLFRLFIALAISHISGLLFAQSYQLVDAFPNISFQRPVLLTYSPDGSNRLFVVEQRGIIKVFPNDAGVQNSEVKTFLDISDKVSVAPFSEYGLLGLAFHPDYAENGLFFIDYVTTTPELKTYVSKFRVSASDPDAADDGSETVVLEVEQVLDNHNAGMVEFGPDGYLYISLGDGGWRYPDGPPDPGATAQDPAKLLGSILRIDVDNPAEGLNYGIPPGNPFAGNTDGYREEIFAKGFRNPWRFSIDQETGKVWVADVGFERYEEIDIVEAGKNYGWSVVEGPDCLEPGSCNLDDFTPPIFFYEHNPDCSITGGYVYHGQLRPELTGQYIFGDWCSGRVRALDYDGAEATSTLLIDTNIGISAFGQDANRELYVLALNYNMPTKIYRFNENATSVKTETAPVRTFSLSQNYPNPFNPTTQISYTLDRPAQVQLKVFDIAGNEIATLVNGEHGAGNYTVDFDGKDLASGVYFYRLDAGSYSKVRKMILVK